MTKEEALKDIKKVYKTYKDLNFTEKVEAFETLIPELKESENKKVLDSIIQDFKDQKWFLKGMGNMTKSLVEDDIKEIDKKISFLEKISILTEYNRGTFYYDGDQIHFIQTFDGSDKVTSI